MPSVPRSSTCAGVAGAAAELLAHRDGKRWRDVSSDDINLYVKAVIGGEVSAKDFRTWHGTVLAAVALAERAADASSRTARTRAVRQAMNDVAAYLGNTPAVARKSYVDPRLVDLFDAGTTIAPTLQRIEVVDGEAARHRIERAVLRLLRA